MRKLLIPLAVLALVGAGCGGPSVEEKYAKAVNDAQTKYAAEMDGFAVEAPSTDVLNQMSTATTNLANRIARIPEVPKDLQDENDALASSINAAALSLKAGDPTLFKARIKPVQDAITRTNEALR